MRVKRWMVILAAVVVVILIAKHFLLGTSPIPEKSDYAIDLDAMHKAAAGALPDHIEVQKIAEFHFPHAFVTAGSDWSKNPMILLSHRVVWADGSSLVIDAAMSPEQMASFPMKDGYDEKGWAALQKAMRNAKAIVLTHEHTDHIAGLATSLSDPQTLAAAKITKEQMNGPRLEKDKFAPGTYEKVPPFEYQGLYAVAPGVVLQHAPGHTPGSQLVYVELENGQRYLFIVDIAWSNENLQEHIGRPKLMQLMISENREQVADEVATIAALPKDVHVIVAHDKAEYESDVAHGLLKDGFSI